MRNKGRLFPFHFFKVMAFVRTTHKCTVGYTNLLLLTRFFCGKRTVVQIQTSKDRSTTPISILTVLAGGEGRRSSMFCTVKLKRPFLTPCLSRNVQLQATVNCSCICNLHDVTEISNDNYARTMCNIEQLNVITWQLIF
jgi:hypothetical protein